MIKFNQDDVELVPIEKLKPNLKNRNKHSSEQIERLSKLISHHGFRQPIIVSRHSGLIVAGHGRLEAARKLNLKEVPVIYQEFTPEEEYSFAISDNAIASWAELDFSGINMDIGELGPGFDVDMLGIKEFKIDPSEKENQFPGKMDLSQQWIIAIQCSGEPDMQELFEEMKGRGYECKLIT